jgi:hypothetical protein
MLSSVNSLGIPLEDFGTSGIDLGNLVHEALGKLNLKGEYHSSTKKITVLYTSDLPLSIEDIREALYCPENKFKDWYPLVEESALNGSFEVRFSRIYPPNTDLGDSFNNWDYSKRFRISPQCKPERTFPSPCPLPCDPW